MPMIEQMVETRACKEVRGLTENSGDCVRNNVRQCNIFWLDAKCQPAVNVWQDITERLW